MNNATFDEEMTKVEVSTKLCHMCTLEQLYKFLRKATTEKLIRERHGEEIKSVIEIEE